MPPPELDWTVSDVPAHSAAPNQWTVAIDLTLNVKDGRTREQIGAEAKAEFLKELQEETRNKPVALVVQLRHPQQESGVQDVSRFLIRDGAVSTLPQPTVADPSGLTADLLRHAGSSQRSENLGLVVFSHGFGRHGIQGDTSKTSLDSLTTSLSGALSSIKRDKLDLLGFDACSMAQADTLAKVAPVARNLVASPEYMLCDRKISCGINLKNWLSELVRHPQMSADDLGDAAVSQVAKTHSDLGAGKGSPTLTHFRLEHNYADFANTFNRFSSQLTDAASDPNNREALLKIVESAPEYERYYSLDPPYPEPKDLSAFAKMVSSAIADGAISDSTGELGKAAVDLVDTQARMTGSYFGADQGTVRDAGMSKRPRAAVPYSRLGGLSISLPHDEQIADAKKDGRDYQRLVEEETIPEFGAWRDFLRALRPQGAER